MEKNETPRSELRNNGWQSIDFRDSQTHIKSLTEIKDRYISELSDIAGPELGVNFHQFDAKRIFEIEIVKAILRGLLRYHPISRKLAASHAVQYSQLVPESSRYYTTQLYPVIHLPNDTSEIGTFHLDDAGYSGQLYTVWTPLNNCDFKPLTIIPKSHSSIRHFTYKVFYNHRFPNNGNKTLFKNVVSPMPKIGTALTWSGKTYHKGNLNLSDKITVAVVSRITEHPFMLEPTRTVQSCYSYETANSSADLKTFSQEFIQTIRVAMKYSIQSKSFTEVYSDFKNLASSISEENRKLVSFGLTILAQRLTGNDSTIFDLASLATGHDNLISLERTLRKMNSNFSERDQFIRRYTLDYNSLQIHQVIVRVCKVHLSNSSNSFYEWN